MHLWGGFAIFHWRCFGEYLRTESEQQVESAVWEASRKAICQPDTPKRQ